MAKTPEEIEELRRFRMDEARTNHWDVRKFIDDYLASFSPAERKEHEAEFAAFMASLTDQKKKEILREFAVETINMIRANERRSQFKVARSDTSKGEQTLTEIGEVHAVETAKLINLYGDELGSTGFLEVAAEAAERLLVLARSYSGFECIPIHLRPDGLQRMSDLMEKVKTAVLFLDAPIKKALDDAIKEVAAEESKPEDIPI